MIIANQKTVSWSAFRMTTTKVHVWHASLEQPGEVIQKLESVLSDEERQRAGQFRFQEHRQSFIISRGILRNILHRYTGIRPDRIQFKYNIAGKPFLAEMVSLPDLSFNLSHSGLLLLYAFSWGHQVGIDVECIRPIEEIHHIAELNFSPRELIKFQRVSEKDRLRVFYNCWTRKEAFIKAIGAGVSFPMSELEVSFEPYEPAKLITVHGSSDEASSWTLHDLMTRDGYAAALVVEGNEHSILHKQWTYTQFL